MITLHLNVRKEAKTVVLTETRYEHVLLNPQGEPVIAGTTMKVKELVAERLAWGWSAEEIFLNHPYLTLGQVYSALAYYADHHDEINQAVEADDRYIEQLRRNTQPSPLVVRLKAQGLI